MKDLTIYDVYVEMQDQEQCDRMKQLCIENNLPIWVTDGDYSFYLGTNINWFEYCEEWGEFFITSGNDVAINYGKTKVTEKEFIELLKQHKHD